MLKDTLLYLAQNQQMREFVLHNGATRKMSRRFVAGETLQEAVDATRVLNQKGISTALDFLGENVFAASEAEEATEHYLAALQAIHTHKLDANISIKLTALGLDIDADLCERNTRKILDLAKESNIFVCIDMEGSDYTERTIEMTLKLHKDYPNTLGTVLQTYLYRCQKDVERLVEAGVRLRLVKGAYKEPENIAFQEKKEVDQNYLHLMGYLLARGNFPAIASHDPRVIFEARRFIAEHHLSKANFEFQMLYGIRQDFQLKLKEKGYNMRVYIPYGTQWYPYLMRRMAERPANLIFIMSNLLR